MRDVGEWGEDALDELNPVASVAHQAITLGEVTLHWRGDRSALVLDAAGEPDALLVADVHLGKAQRYQALGQQRAGSPDCP